MVELKRSNMWMINDNGRWKYLCPSPDGRSPLEFGEYEGETKGGNVRIRRKDKRILYFKLSQY